MTPWGPGTAILFIVALGFGLVLLVWGVFATFPRVMGVVTRSFWCPFRERNVTVEFQEEPWDGGHVEVNRCSAFSPPNAVACEKDCLRLRKLPSGSGRVRAA